MPELTPDIAKLREALAYAKRYPQYHDQVKWVRRTDAADDIANFPVRAGNGEHPPCGTTLCLAGWGAFLNAPEGSVIDVSSECVFLPDGITVPVHAGHSWQTSRPAVGNYAGQVFGLTVGQGHALFYAAQDADELERVIDAIETDPGADFHTLIAMADINGTGAYGRDDQERDREPFTRS